MNDKAKLRKLIDDVNEIEKVARETKAARTCNREPGAEVRAILDRWEHDGLIIDDQREVDRRLGP
jgi:hypothetical protein